jgi:hypothetical protein
MIRPQIYNRNDANKTPTQDYLKIEIGICARNLRTYFLFEELEYTKEVIIIRISKNRQQNSQQKKYKQRSTKHT